jgi:hypothetical protein
VYVTFHLGPPVHSTYIFDPGASVPFIEGSLHLVWSFYKGRPLLSAQPSGRPQVAGKSIRTSAAGKDVDGVEQMFATALSHLPSQQVTSLRTSRSLGGKKVVATHALPLPAVEVVTAPLAKPQVAHHHAIKGGPATQKLARDEAQMKALCAATKNSPAGLPAKVCAFKSSATH